MAGGRSFFILRNTLRIAEITIIVNGFFVVLSILGTLRVYRIVNNYAR